MVIHCLISKERKVLSKALWIIFILVTWFFGSIIYGLFASRKALIQWIAGSIFAVGFLATFFFVNSLYQVARVASSEAMQKMAMIKAGEITEEHIAQLRGDLSTLQKEIQDARGIKTIYFIKEAYKDLVLSQIFIVMMKDGQMGTIEYNTWTSKFNDRRKLDAQELVQYLKSFEQK